MTCTRTCWTSALRAPLTGALAALALTLSGCGSSPSSYPPPAGTDATQAGAPADPREEQLAQREAELDQREAELSTREGSAAAPPAAQHGTRGSTAVRPAPARGAAPTGAAPQTVAETPADTGTATPRSIELPAGTELRVELLEGLSSGTSAAGQAFRARLAGDVSAGGTVVLPAGSTVTGSVSGTVPRKKIGGQAQISLAFDGVELPSGQRVAIAAALTEMGEKQTGKDAATIGGAAVAGAILGHQVDDKKGKLIGAVIGGAAGTAAAAKMGKDVELPAGTLLAVVLDQPVQVPLAH